MSVLMFSLLQRLVLYSQIHERCNFFSFSFSFPFLLSLPFPLPFTLFKRRWTRHWRTIWCRCCCYRWWRRGRWCRCCTSCWCCSWCLQLRLGCICSLMWWPMRHTLWAAKLQICSCTGSGCNFILQLLLRWLFTIAFLLQLGDLLEVAFVLRWALEVHTMEYLKKNRILWMILRG